MCPLLALGEQWRWDHPAGLMSAIPFTSTVATCSSHQNSHFPMLNVLSSLRLYLTSRGKIKITDFILCNLLLTSIFSWWHHQFIIRFSHGTRKFQTPHHKRYPVQARSITPAWGSLRGFSWNQKRFEHSFTLPDLCSDRRELNITDMYIGVDPVSENTLHPPRYLLLSFAIVVNPSRLDYRTGEKWQ